MIKSRFKTAAFDIQITFFSLAQRLEIRVLRNTGEFIGSIKSGGLTVEIDNNPGIRVSDNIVSIGTGDNNWVSFPYSSIMVTHNGLVHALGLLKKEYKKLHN